MFSKLKHRISKETLSLLNKTAGFFGFEVRKIVPNFYLHKYASYEEYKAVQIHHNKRKIESVWADEQTLTMVAKRIHQEFGTLPKDTVLGLCHGTRNGFEQKFLKQSLQNAKQVLGTDISDTAANFPSSVQWDFHDANEEWLGKHHFIYTNSLDQSWKPDEAVKTWIDQLVIGGLLMIEHTEAHSTKASSEMDPFGADPFLMPYLLSQWLGHKVSIEILQGRKDNFDLDVWLFVIKRLD